MYLAKIELLGFKSFAQKVRIRFDKGLTAIVGPNGCGKTNVVDAMRWVLGEQKSSLLRSAKMENIIFNGTRTLKPLSMAEVSLTIENSRNVLPLEYTEVTITRRLYRNGESEFFLNQVACRLKDILDLFTDTGMSSDAYSVIELKMIEEIISNKSEERLKLFEEAAGITRYKQRRKQTFKLLESTSRDLLRVDDVLAEVEKKVRSLKTQVRKAERLREIKERIRALELALAWRSMEELHDKLEPMQRSISKEELINHEQSATIARMESASQEMELTLLKQEGALAELQKVVRESNQKIHELEKQQLYVEEQQKTLTADVGRMQAARHRKEEKSRELQQQDLELRQRLEPAKSTKERLLSEYQERSREHEEHNATLIEQRNRLKEQRQASSALLHKANQFILQKQALESEQQQLRAALLRLEERLTATRHKLQPTAQAAEETTQALQQISTQLAHSQAEEERLAEQQQALQQQIEQQKEALLRHRSTRDALNNRIALANALLDTFEGMPEGIAFLEKERQKNGGLEGHEGHGGNNSTSRCLADMIEVDERYRAALGSALGDHLNCYLCPTLSDAHHSIALLQKAQKGKLLFLVQELAASASLPTLPTIEGAEPLANLVSVPPAWQHALRLLLGTTFVVANAEQAEALVKRYPAYRFVTLAGELSLGGGLLRGGSNKSNEGLRLGKQAERAALLEEVAKEERSMQHLEQTMQQLRNELAMLPIPFMRRQIEQFQREKSAIEKKAARLEAEEQSMQQELMRGEKEHATLLQEQQQSAEKLTALMPFLIDATAQSEAAVTAIEQAQQALQAKEATYHQVGRDAQSCQSRYRDAELALEKLTISLNACTEQQRTTQHELRRLHDDLATAERKQRNLQEQQAALQQQLESARHQNAEEQQRFDSAESAYREAQAQHHTTLATLRDMRRKQEVSRQLLDTLLREKRELEQSLDHLLTETRIKYECDLALMEEPPIARTLQPNEAQHELASLQEQRSQFGAVNELALEEYEEEKKRLDFLLTQKNDLLSAEAQLRSTIEEINKTALEKFETTFSNVRNNFIAIFRELFDEDDEVDLLLHSSTDPLEGRIEIIARPKGKKPLSIEQLSGGEKALTALSLLFAIYLVKPSPFCILDEVDAPLDDANVSRFIRLLKKFENNTQFIIVTHNKKTMASCRLLYGITMEEEGVSKMIPVRLEKAP
uniref:Chromosome partition protein Smc n=1 Tax=Chlorobium chlorochromatii (strain CaD3) TaxID=340177 RepID=Q3ATI3_CHLCH